MKKAIIVAILICLIFLLLRYQNNSKVSTDASKVRIVTSFYPLYFMASNIAGDQAEIRNIIPSGAEPHEYEPTTRDIVYLEQSDLLFLNGSLEPWINHAQQIASSNKLAVVVTGERLISKKNSNDPHIWLNPVLAQKQAEVIYQAIVNKDPKNLEYYKSNWEKLKASLNALDAAYSKGLSRCKRNTFVTTHRAFGYMADEYGLKELSVVGISPDEEVSAQRLAELTKFIKQNHIPYVFTEKLSNTRLSETLSHETGAKVLVLDPIEGVADSDLAMGEEYISIMMKNLTNLQTALECTK